jgi:transposase-like protein
MKTDESVKNLNKVIKNDEDRIKNHLGVMVRSTVEETLGYYHFPREHWCQIRTNNPLERIMRQIRRRSRVVGCFPDGNSALMLAAARQRYIAGTRWDTKQYMNKAKRIDLLQSMSPSDKDEKAAIEVVNLIF